MTAGPIIRLFDPAADIPRLLRLFNTLEALDNDPEPSTEASIRSQLNWRGHNPAVDRWVVEKPGDPDTLIGHGWVFKQSDQRSAVKVTIHPDYRRMGIGSAVLARILARVQKIGTPVAVSGTDFRNTASLAFLEKHGFQAVSSNWFMRAPGALPLATPVLPQGYTVRRYCEITNPAALAGVFNRGYGDMAGHTEHSQPIDADHVTEAFVSSRWDAEGLFVVIAPDGDWVGACQVKINGRACNASGIDILDAPAIVPDYRGEGLIGPLLLTAMHWQHKNGSGDILLESYGDSQTAVAVYEELGFVLQERFIEYERQLTGTE